MEREKIRQAAFEVFSEKGFMKAGIAEIARKAGVTDSKIYKHFSSKEELLYEVPKKAMGAILDQVNRELKGIRDVTSLLSKFIWIQLEFSEDNRDITRIILECRSHQDWYRSEAYGLIREYGSVLQQILEKGVQEGVFRGDLNLRLMLNIIFGTTDFEHLSFLISQEIESQKVDLDDIMDLILPMVEKRHLPEKELTDKSARILTAAEHVFSKFGFVKAKVLEISELAGVSEGTVYEYFKTKEDLLLAISTKHLRQHMKRLDEVFEIKHPLQKLRRLMRYHFTLYLANRDFLKVFIINTQLRSNFFQSEAYKTFRDYYQVIENIIEEGKAEGVFRQNANTRIFRNMFLGAFSHMSIRWFVLDSKAEVDMMGEIDQLINLLSVSLLIDEARISFHQTHNLTD